MLLPRGISMNDVWGGAANSLSPPDKRNAVAGWSTEHKDVNA